LSDHQSCARAARQALWIARSSLDAPTEHLLTQRLEAHEEAVWKLKSLLAEDTPFAMRQAA
jgi:DNA-binding ferritin-like protein